MLYKNMFKMQCTNSKIQCLWSPRRLYPRSHRRLYPVPQLPISGPSAAYIRDPRSHIRVRSGACVHYPGALYHVRRLCPFPRQCACVRAIPARSRRLLISVSPAMSRINLPLPPGASLGRNSRPTDHRDGRHFLSPGNAVSGNRNQR